MFDPGITSSTAPAPCMTTSEGNAVALRGVRGDMKINDLFLETILEQTYQNVEQDNIEAVYTFAVPMDAVLLELTIHIGDREMKGSVLDKEEAEQAYEDAMIEGDTAGLLEKSAEGMMTMNVGNMMPGEVARVRLRFGQLLRFQEDEVRISLPLTIAPRYGDPAQAGLADHQQFEHTLEDVAGFSLSVVIRGMLAHSRVDSPSHKTIQTRKDDALYIRLTQERVPLDRDFILTMRAEHYVGTFAHQDIDGEGSVVLAGFRPQCPDNVQMKPVNVKLVVDCSGSMNGDSMVQARQGLKLVLDALRPEDWFSLTTFGSTWQHHHAKMVPTTRENIALAKEILQQMNADMGGTELGKAMYAVYGLPVPEGQGADILLITDGEVYEGDQLTRKARASGHRIFTVGVGSAVCEATVRGLADSTGGACELVSPNENMAERIHRHFLRMTRPQATIKALTWPAKPRIQVPARPVVFAGDTLFVAAFMDRQIQGQVVLELDWGMDAPTRLAADIQDMVRIEAGSDLKPGNIVRVAASMMIEETDDPDKARELSLRYQLVGEHTSYLLVLVREDGEKAKILPVLRKTPHTLAAGWGGTGSAMAYMPQPCSVEDSAPMYLRKPKAFSPGSEYIDAQMSVPPPMFSMSSPDAEWERVVSNLNNWLDDDKATEDIGLNINDIKTIGVSGKIFIELIQLVDDGHEERAVIASFLLILKESPKGKGLTRQAKRIISWHGKHVAPDLELLEKVRQILNITKSSGEPFWKRLFS